MTQQYKSNLSDKLRNIVCVLRKGGVLKEWHSLTGFPFRWFAAILTSGWGDDG